MRKSVIHTVFICTCLLVMNGCEDRPSAPVDTDGCDERPAESVDTDDCDESPSEPESGVLKVVTKTSGISPDGYLVALDGSDEFEVAGDDTLEIDDLEERSYTIEINGISHHCTLDGDNVQTIEVTNGEISTVEFTVSCQTDFSRRILFLKGTDFQSTDFYTVNPDGSDLTRLTNSDQWYKQPPAFLPEMDLIAFAGIPYDADGSHPPDGATTDIFIMNRDGTGIANITNTPSILVAGRIPHGIHQWECRIRGYIYHECRRLRC